MREKFDECYLIEWTTDKFIKSQENMKKLIEIYNSGEKITDMYFLELVQDNRNTYEDFYADFDFLISEVFPD